MTLAILKQPLIRLSDKYAQVVISKPWLLIVLPILATAFLSTGIIFKMRIVRGVHYLYSPLDSEGKIEEEVFKQLWTSDDNRFYPGKDVLLRKGLYLIVSAKDEGDVLRQNLCEQLVFLLDSIANSTIPSDNGQVIKFTDVCFRFQNQCFANTHVRLLAQIFSKDAATKLNVTYPLFSSSFLTEPLDLSSTLGGIELDSTGHFVHSAKAWMLAYQLRKQTVQLNRISSEFQYKLLDLLKQLDLPDLEIAHLHAEAFDNELAKNTIKMVPRFAVTFAILIIFSVLCTFTMTKAGSHLVIDWVLSKPLLGIAGVLTTLMAIVSAAGLLLLLDVTFVDICCVMPFLCLSIGVDDSFLLLSAWRETSCNDCMASRIEQTLKHSGVAIFITSLADSLAFLIGAMSTMPAVRYFSLYSAVAICFIYIYTITIFTAIIVLQGRWEQKCFNSVWGCETKSIAEQKEVTIFTKLFNIGSRQHFVTKKHLIWYQEFFAKSLANFITRTSVQVLALLSYVIYLVITFNGLHKLKVGFDLMDIVTQGSPTEHFIQLRSEYFPNDVSQLDLAVLQPVNMGNRTERNKFLTMLRRFEQSECSSGRAQTKFWYFAYQSYLNEMGFAGIDEDTNLNYTMFYQQIQPFLLSSAKYEYDIIDNEQGDLQQFRLSIGLKPLHNDEQVLRCAKEMRNLCKDVRRDFDIVTYSTLWDLADQLDIVWPQTLQDIFISVFLMFFVTLLFMPQHVCAIIISLSIVSVSFGVLGFLHFMNAKLNATSMISLAMSVGFSVDFSSHITHGFISVESEDAMTKLSGALRFVGWPIFQTSSAVFLGISTLGTFQNQLVQTVFKAVLLVIVFGLVHALVYIPLLLLKMQQLRLLRVIK